MNYYDILGVTRESTDEEIKKAYKKKVLQYHPDKNKDKGAEDMFKKITNAYKVLSDKKRRRVYDLTGNTDDCIDLQSAFKTFMDNFTTNDMKEMFSDCINIDNIPQLFDSIKNSGFNFSIHTFSGINAFDDIPFFKRDGYPFLRKDEDYEIVDVSDTESDILKDEVYVSDNKINNNEKIKNEMKGKNLYYDLYVSLEDVYCRKKKKVSVSRFRLNKEKGEYVKEKIKLYVPLYKEEVIFKEEADESEKYEKPGDVIININYKPCDSCYMRNGHDLVYEKDISVSELYNGGLFTIKLLNGKELDIKFGKDLLVMEDGMREIKVKGKGLPTSNKTRGDLYINFSIKFPQLTEKEISIVNKLFPTLL
jgi:DnaJ-class molecular chaperone